MVKVAVISDIHGNYIALEELLKDAKESGVFVDYGSYDVCLGSMWNIK